MRSRFVPLLMFLGYLLASATASNAQAPQGQITFDNQSGQSALVKLIGPTRQAVQVPNGAKRTIRATGGHGTEPEHYFYSKGDSFTVAQTRRQYSIITITLHTVVNGNYHTNPIGASDFDRENAPQ